LEFEYDANLKQNTKKQKKNCPKEKNPGPGRDRDGREGASKEKESA
jgi:hypothetical protein